MHTIHSLEFQTGSREELLPGYTPDFPYIASRVELDSFREKGAPWHWHKPVELFFMESGELQYFTPSGTVIFPAGSGGMVNSNVLHMTKVTSSQEKTVQLLHLFDPSLIAGEYGSRIAQKYVTPVTADSRLEIIPLFPDDSRQAAILASIQRSLRLSEKEPGYELKLRDILSDIWLRLFALSCHAAREIDDGYNRETDKIKSMMVYIHEHYAEKITVSQLAGAAFLSERECYRTFQHCLHMTPAEYIKNYRLQAARQMLAKSGASITHISHSCGLGNSSYFGKLFRESTGYTPSQYRQKWQGNHRK